MRKWRVVVLLLAVALGVFLAAVGIDIVRFHLRRPHIETEKIVANLYVIRNAVATFQADVGRYPVTLRELAAKDQRQLAARAKDGATVRGPYLRKEGQVIGDTVIPVNPFVDPHDPHIAHHWHYDPATGSVRSAVDAVLPNGKSFQSL